MQIYSPPLLPRSALHTVYLESDTLDKVISFCYTLSQHNGYVSLSVHLHK